MRLQFKHELRRLNATLEEYARVSRLTAEEVLDKKGRDVGIQVWRGFWAIRLKATRAQRVSGVPVFTGPAFTEARARGWRVKIRNKTLEGAYAAIAPRKNQKKKTRGVKIGRRRRQLNRQALLVAQELATRQRGAGLLGASFLFKRWRRRKSSNGRTEYFLEQNKSGKIGILSTLEKGRDSDGNSYIRISNKTPGVVKMARRHGIIGRALRAVRSDTATYLVRKQLEALKRTQRKSS